MSKQIKPPWLVRSNEAYIAKHWEAYADYECWLLDQLGESMYDAYHDMDGTLQSNLYGVFCSLFQEVPE